MEFWKVVLGLLRRRLLIFPLLAAAITLGVAGYFLTPLKYIASTTMVLVTPAFGGTLSQNPAHPTDLTNPMLTFNDNLKTASAILIHAMNTRDVAAELGALDGPTDLTIDDGRSNPDLILNSGPFVYIEGESTSRSEAKDVVIRAQKRIRQELIDRQKALSAPPETYITLNDVVMPAIPEVSRANRIKVGGIAFVLSFLMGLSAAYAWQRRNQGAALPIAAALRPTENEQLAADEVRGDEDASPVVVQLAADEVPGDEDASPVVAQLTADEVQAVEAVQSVEPEKAAYPEQEGETEMHWKLYVVDYPPPDGGPAAHGTRDDESDLGWDWYPNGAHSAGLRQSVVVK